ncbi:myosin heavy chain, neuronal [Rhodopirellula islandica]|uniref:Myosin heavy chain, neuronal n=1 Tax=Rhodopirellula islandica TaxID=595434 RepID=A0A0J1BL19_RHOIS|nr:hypothetical protein [Rhodopirellula islandica]KLU07128.1 myosin heavy chain, neuronal [Rhodopirellula islandica]
MQYVLLLVLIVVVIAQAILVWKAAPHWRWYQITPVVITTILAVIFVFPVAGALKSRSEWHKVKEELESRLASVEAEQLELRYGNPNDPLSGEGVLPMAQKLAKLGTEAGRRWRGLRLTNADFNNGGQIVLSSPQQEVPVDGLPAEEADEGEVELAPLPLIPDGLVVYGFAEGPQPNLNVPGPIFYLGEYRVTATSPTQVTLQPTAPLLPQQRQAIESRQAVSWSVYELLPLDGHEPFVAEGSVEDDNNVFGRIDDELVNRLLSNQISAQSRAEYLRDGTRSLPDDEPLSKWVKIEFTKNHEIVVDSPDQRGALDGGFFDGSGRAVDSRLQQGDSGKVKFSKDDLLVVKEEAADALIDEGVARLIDTYYVRPLNDYRFVLRRIRLRLAELSTRTQELTYENEVLQRAIDATKNMTTAAQAEKLKLEQDFEQTEVERISLETYNEKLATQLKETHQRLVKLYRSNQQLEKELQMFHESIVSSGESLTSAR